MSLINKEKTMEEIPIDVCDGFEVTDIIEKMPTVKAIPLEKLKDFRNSVMNMNSIAIIHRLDKLIEEVEEWLV